MSSMKPNPTRGKKRMKAWMLKPKRGEGEFHAGELFHTEEVAKFCGNGRKPVHVLVTELAPKRGRGRGR